MKKLLCALVPLLLLVLSGCGGQAAAPASSAGSEAPPPALTEAEVLAAYQAAAEAYDWFTLATLPVAGDAVTQDGMTFQPVTDAHFSTMADLEAHLKGLFTDELTAALLSDGQYRDIGGRLYATGGARGANLYLLGKTVGAEQPEEDRWTVTLTFYADSYDMERPSVTIGYSRKTIDYVNQDDRWGFATFCPSDDLDLEAETVFRHTYDDATFDAYPYSDYSDLQLALHLLHADGAFSEGPGDQFAHRFLEAPESVMAALAVVEQSPWEHREHVVSSIGHVAAVWFAPELLPDFEGILSSCAPKNEAEQAVLEKISAAYQERLAEHGPDYGNPAREFGFVLGSGTMLSLGAQAGQFPWGYDLTGTPKAVEGSDFGQGYEVDCGKLTLHYFQDKDGIQSLSRMSTTVPYTEENYVFTVRGLCVGSGVDSLLYNYPKAVRLEADGWDAMYIYEPGGEAFCKHIAFYVRDGVVAKIEIEDLIDSRLLPE